MAEEKKKKFRTKVYTTQASNPEVDNALDQLLIMAATNTTNGQIKFNYKKEAGKFTKEVKELIGELSDEQKAQGQIIKNAIISQLTSVDEGQIKVNFVSELEII